MRKSYLETIIGFIVIITTIIFAFMVLKISNKKLVEKTYTLIARFDNVEGISIGTKIKIGGLDVGSVKAQVLDEHYRIKLILKISYGIVIPDDSTIIVSTSGIIGGKYLKIQPGGSEEALKDKEEFEFTQSTMDLEDMIGRFLLNKK